MIIHFAKFVKARVVWHPMAERIFPVSYASICTRTILSLESIMNSNFTIFSLIRRVTTLHYRFYGKLPRACNRSQKFKDLEGVKFELWRLGRVGQRSSENWEKAGCVWEFFIFEVGLSHLSSRKLLRPHKPITEYFYWISYLFLFNFLINH